MSRQVLTVEDLTFDPEAHRTTAPDGSDVPHVTAVLEAVGVSTEFEELMRLCPWMAGRIEAARELGQIVHQDCHAYDDDDLVMESVWDRALPFLQAWIQCREEKGLVPVRGHRERQVYHPLHHYTGILDGVFVRESQKRLVLVDTKTGDPESAAAHLQTAAYLEAWLETKHAGETDTPRATVGDMGVERWAVWLRPGKRIPYTIVNYTADERWEQYDDFAKFAACLTVYREQAVRRARVR